MSYKVELVIDEDVLKSLEQKMGTKGLADSFYGPGDTFLLLILQGWKEGRTKLHIETKKEREKRSHLGRRK